MQIEFSILELRTVISVPGTLKCATSVTDSSNTPQRNWGASADHVGFEGVMHGMVQGSSPWQIAIERDALALREALEMVLEVSTMTDRGGG